MNYLRQRLRATRSSDSGLSLIEVIIAVAIIAVVALSSANLTINGINTASAQARRQAAVTIASSQIETVSSKSVLYLNTGRWASNVTAAWAANSAYAGVTATYPGSDPLGSPTSAMLVPITRYVSMVGAGYTVGTIYTVTTLIGTCYQAAGGGDCSTLAAYPQPTPPSTTPSSYTLLVRAIVVVSWTVGATCSTGGCRYTTTTLIDPNSDLKWVSHG